MGDLSSIPDLLITVSQSCRLYLTDLLVRFTFAMAPIVQDVAAPLLHAFLRRATVEERLTPNDEQKLTLYVLLGYVIGITILWNLWGLKYILLPWKLFTVTLHEFCHAAAGCCTGARIVSIEVDPNQGGLTRMKGGFFPAWT